MAISQGKQFLFAWDDVIFPSFYLTIIM